MKTYLLAEYIFLVLMWALGVYALVKLWRNT